MRAVVLSRNSVIEFLNENFINTWVSNFELERTPNKEAYMAVRREHGFKPFDRMHPLAQGIMKGWKKRSPSDSLILSTDLELMGRQPVNDLIGSHMIRDYLTFLKEALDGKLPGFGEDTSEPEPLNSDTVLSSLKTILNDVRTSQEILNIFRTPEPGYQDYTVIEIDAATFENGGVLTIDISVGHAEAAGSFDLFAGDSKLPTEGVPDGALASAWGIPPGGTERITYPFDRGQSFQFGATGDWFSKKGSTNAFLATISVKPNQKPESRKVSPMFPEQSAEDVMNTFVEAFKNLDAETILPMLTGDATETFEGDFADVSEDMRAQISEMLSEMEILSSEYVGDEFHFRLRVPMAPKQELSVKIRKVEGIWLIYDAK